MPVSASVRIRDLVAVRVGAQGREGLVEVLKARQTSGESHLPARASRRPSRDWATELARRSAGSG